MAKSERSRWVKVFETHRPHDSAKIETVQNSHDQLRAVVDAFEAVGRVIRVEPAKFGQGLIFKARRA